MTDSIRTLVLTGMSGAGKTVAMQSLEDIGYFCIDNLPPVLIPRFVDMIEQSNGSMEKVALACDLRGGELFQPFLDTVQSLRSRSNLQVTLIFLDASNETLVRRYKESRRRHPFAPEARLLEGIEAERNTLAQVRMAADVVLETSHWRPAQLKQEIIQRFTNEKNSMPVHLLSFGFKYGIPIDADMIFDVRFLPNPHYIDELRPYTGENQPVYDYVMQWPATAEFLKKTEDLLDFLIPEFTKEGKSHLVVAIGCTGGRHRSVAIAKYLQTHLANRVEVNLMHRDADRGQEV